MTAGAINGYAVVWGAVSQDFGVRGEAPRYERIEKGALKIASDAVACVSHVRFTSFAFRSDASLQLGLDNTGLWFRATLPETSGGYGIRNSLAGGQTVGASVEIDERVARYVKATRVEVVTWGLVVGIALTKRPIYLEARAWLDGDVPNDPKARALHSHFVARNRRRPPQILIGGLQPMAFARKTGIYF
jgi:phage head maturation protease